MKIDTRSYELAALKAIFNKEDARSLISLATIHHFSCDDLREVFRSFQRLHFQGAAISTDLIVMDLVAGATMSMQQSKDVVASIEAMPAPENLTYLVQGIGKIQAQNKLGDLVEFLQTPDAVRNGLAGALTKINDFVISQHSTSSRKTESLTDALARALGRTEPAKVWAPGLGKLDDYWKIRKGSYTVIGGDSGSGKTALLVNMMLSIARQDTHVGVISIEMTTDELTYRAAAVEAGVDHSRIEDGVYNESERAAINNSLKKNADLYSRIHVIDPAFLGADELHGIFNELAIKHGCEVIFIDYIQRIRSREKTVKSKMDEVSSASETITAVTKATGVATIALSVLARDQGATRKGLDHLKHSGQIGHDAHTVVIITPQQTDDIYAPEKTLICEAVKNRKGRFFCEPLTLHGPTQRISHAGFNAVKSKSADDPF
jgi:replicative DNA helicase